MKANLAILLVLLATLQETRSHGEQPLSKIDVHKAVFALHDLAYVKASPSILGITVCFIDLVACVFHVTSFLIVHLPIIKQVSALPLRELQRWAIF